MSDNSRERKLPLHEMFFIYDVINMPPPVGKDYNEYLRISGKEKRCERENND